MSLEETNRLIERQAVVEDYIKSLNWDDTTEDYVKTVVAGNLRAFWSFLNDREPEQEICKIILYAKVFH